MANVADDSVLGRVARPWWGLFDRVRKGVLGLLEIGPVLRGIIKGKLPLHQLKQVLAGTHEIAPRKYIVDLDADPFVPEGWKVEEHIKGGQFEFDPTKVVLHLDEEQREFGVIVSNRLWEGLKGRPVYNANLLDFYLAHPHLIPEEWKGKEIFFWGTIYCHSNGFLCIRCLVWRARGWESLCDYFDRVFHDNCPAAMSASS